MASVKKWLHVWDATNNLAEHRLRLTSQKVPKKKVAAIMTTKTRLKTSELEQLKRLNLQQQSSKAYMKSSGLDRNR